MNTSRPSTLSVPLLLLPTLLALACSSSDAETGPAPAAPDVAVESPPADAGAADVALAADAADAGPTVAPPADPCLNEGTDGASATCLTPKFPASYYAEQSSRYFDTLDVDADPESVPNYSELVVRWEWPPWLLLTGFGRQDMIDTGLLLKAGDPSTVPVRDCRGFDTQPFGRCYVVFEYEGGSCPIYEEFTFNDQGEMTFIEAWSDLPGLRPAPLATDRWAEVSGRLSTRVPGLGNAEGRIDLDSTWMKAAAAADPDVAELAERAADWWTFWYEALATAPKDFFAKGCGW